MERRNEIVFFETKDKSICLPVPIDRDTVWLTQDQMSELFDTARSSIAYHIGKIFKEGELQRGVEFRQWANTVLKQYILKGYAINEKRLQALKKTVEIQTRMLADTLELEQKDVLAAVDQYTQAQADLDEIDCCWMKRIVEKGH